MGWVTVLGPDRAQVEYRLSGSCGCDAEHAQPGTPHSEVDAQLAYRLRGERPLEWIGRGLAEVGLEAGSVLGEADKDAARRLADGCHPVTGKQLVKPKLAVDPRGTLDAVRLVDQVRAVADARGVPPADLFVDQRAAERFARLDRGVVRRGDAHRAPVLDLIGIAEAVGLDPRAVYGTTAVDQALQFADHRVRVGNRGYDLTLDLPKSVSVLYALAGPELAAAIEDEYLAAVRETVAMVEDVAGYALGGHHGGGKRAERLDTSGMLGWVMLHRSARPLDSDPGDPHLHAHVTIINMVRAEDGVWRTVAAGGRDLLRHARVADALVEARLRARLLARFGVRWEREKQGRAWEIVGIHAPVRTLFSRRYAQVVALASEGESGSSKTLAAKSRERKHGDTPQTDVRANWRERASALVDVEAMVAAAAPGPDGPTADGPGKPNGPQLPPAERIAAAVFHPEHGLTAHAKVFTRAQALAAVLEECGEGVADWPQVETLTDQVLAVAGYAVQLPGRGATHLSNSARYTTQDILDAEAEVVAQTRARFGTGVAVVDADAAHLAVDIVEAAQGWAFSAEQRAVLDRLVRAGHGVDCVVGVPGSGKTTLMSAARSAWESAGLVVAGASTAAVACATLAAESGIPSRTIAAWQHALREGDGFAGIDVLVLDEAAMVDDRALAELLPAAAAHGTKVVQLGDPKQLKAIGVGGGFAEVHRLVGGLTLAENRRQRHPVERAALAAMRVGERRAALRGLAETGHVHAVHTVDQAHTAMLQVWDEARTAWPDRHERIRELLLMAPRNADVDALNAGARAFARAAGDLGEDQHFRLAGGGVLDLAVGDVVRVRANDYRAARGLGPDVLNGYRALVVAFDEDRRVQIEWQRPGGDGRRTERAWIGGDRIADGELSHGYALTVASAQGLTADQALIYGIGADAHTLYPALSRARTATHLWLPAAVLEDDAVRAALGEARTDAELLDRAVDAYVATFERDRPDTLVTHELESPAEPVAFGVQEDEEAMDRKRAAALADLRAALAGGDAPRGARLESEAGTGTVLSWRERPHGAVPTDALLGLAQDADDAAAEAEQSTESGDAHTRMRGRADARIHRERARALRSESELRERLPRLRAAAEDLERAQAQADAVPTPDAHQPPSYELLPEPVAPNAPDIAGLGL